MKILNIAIVLFSTFLAIPFGNSQSKEYQECPEFNRELCLGEPTNEFREIFECHSKDDCDSGRKCCNHCSYSYKICTETHIQENKEHHHGDETLKNLYCPKVKPCSTHLLYDTRYRCGSDENCQYGYRCCRSDCYIHKVCVIPVDEEEKEIILTTTEKSTSKLPSPTALHTVPHFTNHITESNSPTYDDEDHKEKTTVNQPHVTQFNSSMHTTASDIESSGSGDGSIGDDEDREQTTKIQITTSKSISTKSHFTNDLAESSVPEDGLTGNDEDHNYKTTTVKATSTQFHFTDDLIESSGSGEGSISDDEDLNKKTTTTYTTSKRATTSGPTPTEFHFTNDVHSSGSGDGSITDDEDLNRKTTTNSMTTSKPTPTEFHFTDDVESSGSGDGSITDDEDLNKKTTTTHTTTKLTITSKLTPTEFHFTDDVESSGSGDRSISDDEDLTTKTTTHTPTAKATTSKLYFTDDIESSSSGDGAIDNDDEDQNQKTTIHTTTHKALVTGEGEFNGSGNSLTSDEANYTQKTTTSKPISTDLHFTPDIESSGSGDGFTSDDEDYNTKGTIHASTSNDIIRTSGSGYGSISDDKDNVSSISTLAPKHTTILKLTSPHDEIEFSGFGDELTDNDDEDNNKYIPVITQTTTAAPDVTTFKTKQFTDINITIGSSGSGDGAFSDDEDSFRSTLKIPLLSTNRTRTVTPKLEVTDDEDLHNDGSGSGDGDFIISTRSSLLQTYKTKPFETTTISTSQKLATLPTTLINLTSIIKQMTTVSDKESGSGNWSVDGDFESTLNRSHLTSTSKPLIDVVIEGSDLSDDEDFTIYITSKPKEWKPHNVSIPSHSSGKEVEITTTKKSVVSTFEGSGYSDDEDLVFLATDIATKIYSYSPTTSAPESTKIDNSIIKESGSATEENKINITNKEEVEENKESHTNQTNINNILKEYPSSSELPHVSHDIPNSFKEAFHSLEEDKGDFSGDGENYDDEDNFV